MERETQYLNVDLEITGRRDLRPLVDALAPHAYALHVGFQKGRHRAALELETMTNKTADTTIRRLAELVRSLPRSARQLWSAAERRDFNIGIQAGPDPHVFECPVSQAAVEAVASVGGRIVITVYGSGVGDAAGLPELRRPVRNAVATRIPRRHAPRREPASASALDRTRRPA